METRRFILALSLSLLVFVGYMRFFAPKPPERPIVPETTKQDVSRETPAQTQKPVQAATVLRRSNRQPRDMTSSSRPTWCGPW